MIYFEIGNEISSSGKAGRPYTGGQASYTDGPYYDSPTSMETFRYDDVFAAATSGSRCN